MNQSEPSEVTGYQPADPITETVSIMPQYSTGLVVGVVVVFIITLAGFIHALVKLLAAVKNKTDDGTMRVVFLLIAQFLGPLYAIIYPASYGLGLFKN